MVQISELRIGNLLTDKAGFIYNVGEINSSTKTIFATIDSNTNQYHLNIENVEPITLTEEWLLKFGWIWNEECKSYEHSDIRMNLEYREMNNSYTMFNYVTKAIICKRIYYVHQLQNLYFALTNKELTWNKNQDKNS